jgi:hypothetical protein
VREFFKDFISTHTIPTGEKYDAITLKDFIQILQQIGINLDTIDIYCIFSKLKYSDDYETIDVSKLLEEMLNYGLFDDNIDVATNPNGKTEREDKKNECDESIDLNKIEDMEVEGLD